MQSKQTLMEIVIISLVSQMGKMRHQTTLILHRSGTYLCLRHGAQMWPHVAIIQPTRLALGDDGCCPEGFTEFIFTKALGAWCYFHLCFINLKRNMAQSSFMWWGSGLN